MDAIAFTKPEGDNSFKGVKPLLQQAELSDIDASTMIVQNVLTAYVSDSLAAGAVKSQELREVSDLAIPVFVESLKSPELGPMTAAAIEQCILGFKYSLKLNENRVRTQATTSMTSKEFEMVHAAKKGNLMVVALAAKNASNNYYADRIKMVIDRASGDQSIEPAVLKAIQDVRADETGAVENALRKMPEWRSSLMKFDGVHGTADLEEIVLAKLRAKRDEINAQPGESIETLQVALDLLELLKHADTLNGTAMKDLSALKNEMIKTCDSRRRSSQHAGVMRNVVALNDTSFEPSSVTTDWASHRVAEWKDVSPSVAFSDGDLKQVMQGLSNLTTIIMDNVCGERVSSMDMESLVGIGLKLTTLLRKGSANKPLPIGAMFFKCGLQGASEVCQYKKYISELAALGETTQEMADGDIDCIAWKKAKQQMEIVAEAKFWEDIGDSPLMSSDTRLKELFINKWEALKSDGADLLSHLMEHKLGCTKIALSQAVDKLDSLKHGCSSSGQSWKATLDDDADIKDVQLAAAGIKSTTYGKSFEDAFKHAAEAISAGLLTANN